MNPFLRYLADKNSAHRHTPMITRPCGLQRAGNDYMKSLFNDHFSNWNRVSWYQNVSTPDFIGAKDDGSGGDNWSH